MISVLIIIFFIVTSYNWIMSFLLLSSALKNQLIFHNSLAPILEVSLLLSLQTILLLVSASLGGYSSWIKGIFVAKLSAPFNYPSPSSCEFFACI